MGVPSCRITWNIQVD